MREDHYVMVKRSNGIWYYYMYRWGKKVYRTTGERKKYLAQEIINDRIRSNDLLCEHKPARPKTFGEFAEGFWDWDTCPIIQDKIQRGGHYSRQSAESYAMRVKKEYIPTFGKKLLPEINNSMIRSWHRNLPGRLGVSAKTANDYLAVLRQMFDEAIRQDLIEKNPCKDVKPLIAEAKIRGCYTQEQIDLLFSTPWDDKFAEAACRLAATTGMRLGEIQALKRDRISTAWLTVDGSWAVGEGRKTTKNGKARLVPLLPEIRQMLLDLPSEGDYVFSMDGVQPLHRKWFERHLWARMEKVGIDPRENNLLFHSFRHYFNTRLVAAGVDTIKIRSIIGHASSQMTERYLHLGVGDLENVRAVQEKVLGQQKKKMPAAG